MKSKPTEAELVLMAELRKGKIKFVFQKGFISGDFYCIVDFYLPKPHKLVIEVDGGYHATPEQKRKDWARDKYLTGRGLRVVRFTNQQVLNNPKAVVSSLF